MIAFSTMETRGESSGNTTPTSISGSSELPVKLVAEIAAMDYEMKALENKVKGKLEDEQQLLSVKNSNLSSLESLTKQLIMLQEQEETLSKNLKRVRDSNSSLEGLEMAVVKNLKALKITNEEQKFKCNNIIKKYSEVIGSHQESFLELPWVKEKNHLSVGVSKKRILLGTLKMQQQTKKANLLHIKQISENRQRIEILRLSQLMIQRNKSLKFMRDENARKKLLEHELQTLEQQKVSLREKIANKTQEMITRIVNRSNTAPQTTTAANPTRTAPIIKNNVLTPEINKPINRSIKDLLGIGKTQLSRFSTTGSRMQTSEDLEKQVKSSNSSNLELQRKEVGGLCSPSSEKVEAEEPMEIPLSNAKMTAIFEVDKSAEMGLEQAVQNYDLPLPRDRHNSNSKLDEKAENDLAEFPHRPKGQLEPSTSQTIYLDKAIPAYSGCTPQSTTVVDSPTSYVGQERDTATNGSSSTQNPEVVTPGELSLGKRPTEGNREDFEESVINSGSPASKKLKMSQNIMLPPRPSSGSQKPKKSNRAPKRVSFMSQKEGKRDDVSERGSGSGSLRPLTPLTTIPEESSPKQQPQSIVAVDAASPPQSSAPDGHSEPEKDDVESKTSGDKFDHLFAPSPQPFSAPQRQDMSGNFESLFGAIFNTPGTSKDDGFQFNVEGAQKGEASNERSNTAPNTGQDFFSFFATPNTSDTKKSYTDNFFNLF